MPAVQGRASGGETRQQGEQVMDLLRENMIQHSAIALGIVVAFVLLAFLARGLLGIVGRRLVAKTVNAFDDRVLEVILSHIRPLTIVAGLQIAVREIRKGVLPDDVTAFQIIDYTEQILYLITVVIIVKIILGVLREIINWYLDRISSEGATNLKMTLGPLANKIVDILIGLVAVIVVLDHFGINIGSLLVSLGVGSLAVALAAQDTLANMIAGFVILVDRPFRVGDRIELATGQVGDVKEIGLRSTRVLNFDNNMIIIPNAELVKGRIVNYAFPLKPMRVALQFDVAYGTDPAKVREILTALAGVNPGILRDPAPLVFLTALTDAAVQFTLVARASEYGEQYAAETTLREQAYLAFMKEGIAVPVVQRIVHMKAIS